MNFDRDTATIPEITTASDPSVELCGLGPGHDWRPHTYELHGRDHTSWRCVWCHAVACGDHGDDDPCMQPYHHSVAHQTRSGLTWPVGAPHPSIR